MVKRAWSGSSVAIGSELLRRVLRAAPDARAPADPRRILRPVRDVLVEIVVGVALAVLGVAVLYLFMGEKAWEVNGDLAFALGALVFSVPAIIVLEIRRRRR